MRKPRKLVYNKYQITFTYCCKYLHNVSLTKTSPNEKK